VVKASSIFNNINELYKSISHAAMRADRRPDEVKLVAVTKTVGIDAVREAVEGGLRVFGESRVQEAKKKILSDEIRSMNEKLEWHMIGNLQKNKARDAVQLFGLIHSVDSVELAEELNRQAGMIGKLQRVLVQVKLSEEETKHGVPESGLMRLLLQIRDMANLRLEGLMTIPPFLEDMDEARPYFRRLRELRDTAVKAGFVLPELSMGMSHDFEAAIGEGATMVRIGTAIFGERS
jgi:pyridoxal phosphate enzyme (YggS family)